ncbi:MAG TPA: hypothetical protein VL523_15455, partial [Terriglobia bacterium]|nr:hypothetical protein [Terriglobia bacterium]
MKRTVMWALAAGLAAGLVIYWTRPAPACGPFFIPTVFTETTHPDFPLGPFTRGRLGVLQPGYERVYLYVAYRNLAGRGFDRAEALALWGIPPESAQLLDQAPKPGPAPLLLPQPQPVDWPHEWVDARNQVAGAEHLGNFQQWGSDAGIYREENGPGGRYEYYLNCQQEAFKTSRDTLQDRTQKYGAGSPELAAWVKAQDEVFSNCQKGENIPAPLGADAPALARTDRQYQIAAAYFYAGDFAKAEAAFREIAGDHASPWSPIASYLVARAYIRQATVGHDDDSPDLAVLARAEAQLKQVLASPRSAEYHASASALLDWVEVRLHPGQRVLQLAQALIQNPAPADLA